MTKLESFCKCELFIFDLGALHTARLGARVYSHDEVYFVAADTQNI
jgi:hypothetical protein